MAISLRTYGTDENPSPTSQAFISIPVPVGVKDGDLLLVALLSELQGATYTPPSSDWTLVALVGNEVALPLAVYWKIAANESHRWVFGATGTHQVVGIVHVRSGCDNFVPVEAYATANSGSATHVNLPAFTPAQNGDVADLFIATTSGLLVPSVTTPAGWNSVTSKSQQNVVLWSYQRPMAGAGAIAAATTALSLANSSAAIVVILSANPGTLTTDDVRERLVGALPAGVEQVYDLEPGGDYYNLFQGIADVLRVYGYDLLDLLRLEADPATCRYKLPDWERVFGLTTSRIALSGTIAQRQAQVVSAWRAAAGQGSTLAVVRAVVGPLLGYADPSQLEIIETSRATLNGNNRYDGSTTVVAPGVTGATVQHAWIQGGTTISKGGARLYIHNLICTATDISVTLIGPDTTQQIWNLTSNFPGNDPQIFYAANFIGKQFDGQWSVQIVSATHPYSFDSWQIEVETIDRTNGVDGTGAEIYRWAVLADPTKIGATSPPDYAAARAAIAKIGQVHTKGFLAFKSQVPGSGGDAVWDDANAIWDACVWG